MELDERLSNIETQMGVVLDTLETVTESLMTIAGNEQLLTDRMAGTQRQFEAMIARFDALDRALTERMAETQQKVDTLDAWFGGVVDHVQKHVTDPDAHDKEK